MRVTQRDVAREAGVSQTIVSDVLQGRARGRVSPETRQRIMEAAERLQYRPNATAQALRLGQSRQIAFVTSRTDVDNFSALSEELLSGIAAVLAEHEHRIVIEVAESYTAIAERLGELVASGSCDGGIVRVLEDPETLWPALREQRAPVVVIGQCPDPALVSIAHDVPGIIRTAQGLLTEAGHTRIGLIAGKRRSHYFRLVDAAWREGLEQRGFSTGWTAEAAGREDAEALVDGWLEAAEGPRAVVCLNERAAFGATRAIVRRGLRVGIEVELVVIGSTAHSWLYEPGTLFFGTDLAGVGRRAAEQLLQALQEQPGAGPIRLRPDWVRL